MKRSSGVRLCATLAVSALSLALVTGCSGGDAKESTGAGGKNDARKPAVKALSAAELKKLIVAEGDVTGYKVKPVTGGTPPRSAVTAAGTSCGTLLQIMAGIAPGDAPAETNIMVQENKKDPTDDATSMEDMASGKFEAAIKESMNIDTTVITLSSYDGDGAEKALTSVSDAVKACAGGFKGEQAGDKASVTKVAGEKGAGSGDASVAFAVTSDLGDGDTGAEHVVVERHGNTLASFTTRNIGAMMSGKAYAVPAPVIQAQTAKLK
ncbi:hypothetical protein [Streptomyces sp. NPDC005573]|uniref:hypothetical protein n=1 Tax=unclassified Streptomyces TaxID=2593676 RepID=UPI0033A0BD49